MSPRHVLMRSIVMYMVATIFFASLDSIAKTMVVNVSLPFVVWGRYAGSLCLLLILLPFIDARQALSSNHLVLQFARGATLIGATASMFAAVGALSVAQSYAISYVSPLIAVLLAAALLKERVSRLQSIGIMLGFIGVMVIIQPGFNCWSWPMLLPATSAFFYALYQILTRLIGKYDSPITSLFYVTLTGALLSSLILPWSYTAMPLSSWGVFGIMGALGTIGHFLLIKAYQTTAASILSPLVYVQIIWAVLIDYFIFNTSLAPMVLIGACIIISAGLLILKGAYKPWQYEQRE